MPVMAPQYELKGSANSVGLVRCHHGPLTAFLRCLHYPGALPGVTKLVTTKQLWGIHHAESMIPMIRISCSAGRFPVTQRGRHSWLLSGNETCLMVKLMVS